MISANREPNEGRNSFVAVVLEFTIRNVQFPHADLLILRFDMLQELLSRLLRWWRYTKTALA
jgi:hypothetical protein